MCREALFKGTIFMMCVFNKILIISLLKLNWCVCLCGHRCGSAHTFGAGQGQPRSSRALLGVPKWVLGHLLGTHGRAGFWFNETQQSDDKSDIQTLPRPEQEAGSKTERRWGRAAVWPQNGGLEPPSPRPWLWRGRDAASLTSAALEFLEIPEVFLQ